MAKGRWKRTVEQRFWDKVEKTDGCWLWIAALHGHGYGRFTPSTDSEELAHRFSWKLHFGAIPAGMCVMHICDVRNCVHPDHLVVGTQGDNIRDMFAKGRGFNVGLAKRQLEGAI